ncbi:hypothetical protein FRC01_010888 [Tulasnella sp. 417]|nr:hypothetical protein FRC01_010888 [Tulasnella sp. 417]
MESSNVLGRTLASPGAADDLRADTKAEHNRLNIQHEMLKVLVGGLFIVPDLVKKALDPTQREENCGVLDIGTGSGIWAVEMAKQFPSAEVVGIDLIHPDNVPEIPPNCRFRIEDANLDWDRYAGVKMPSP